MNYSENVGAPKRIYLAHASEKLGATVEFQGTIGINYRVVVKSVLPDGIAHVNGVEEGMFLKLINGRNPNLLSETEFSEIATKRPLEMVFEWPLGEKRPKSLYDP